MVWCGIDYILELELVLILINEEIGCVMVYEHAFPRRIQNFKKIQAQVDFFLELSDVFYLNLTMIC